MFKNVVLMGSLGAMGVGTVFGQDLTPESSISTSRVLSPLSNFVVDTSSPLFLATHFHWDTGKSNTSLQGAPRPLISLGKMHFTERAQLETMIKNIRHLEDKSPVIAFESQDLKPSVFLQELVELSTSQSLQKFYSLAPKYAFVLSHFDPNAQKDDIKKSFMDAKSSIELLSNYFPYVQLDFRVDSWGEASHQTTVPDIVQGLQLRRWVVGIPWTSSVADGYWRNSLDFMLHDLGHGFQLLKSEKAFADLEPDSGLSLVENPIGNDGENQANREKIQRTIDQFKTTIATLEEHLTPKELEIASKVFFRGFFENQPFLNYSTLPMSLKSLKRSLETTRQAWKTQVAVQYFIENGVGKFVESSQRERFPLKEPRGPQSKKPIIDESQLSMEFIWSFAPNSEDVKKAIEKLISYLPG